MRERGKGGPARERPGVAGRPRIIVDFEVDDDLLLVVIRNIGDEPAAAVRVGFSPTFRGLGGSVEVPGLSLFRRLAFLAPGCAIRALVDPLSAYLGRAEPAEPRIIRVRVRYRDGAGRLYQARIRHDLGIWEDLPRPGRGAIP